MKLIEYVNQVFEKGGVLEKLGGRSVSEQYHYATSVALSIMERDDCSDEDPRLSLLQADTGVGKTFGYMIPIMIQMAINPDLHDKKYVISTYTRQLQKQILSEDIPFIRKVLKELGLDSNQTVCLRMGRQSFFSASRVRGICEKLVKIKPERRDELKSFINTVDDICVYGSGLWADYIEEYGDLPNGITSQDICLLNHQKNDDEAYKLHLEQASLSNIIITNHHSILMPKLTGLSKFDVAAIVVDEAHKISPICQELFNYSIGVNELTSLLTKISTKSKSASSQIGEALATLSTIEVSLKKHPKFDSLDYINHLNA
ncbi:TPA: DEAD/DEAH box helicase, partial [Acinetobacter baumannii]|nr:DEAD/DEAH box helicase [Acinetobacter baumannii]